MVYHLHIKEQGKTKSGLRGGDILHRAGRCLLLFRKYRIAIFPEYRKRQTMRTYANFKKYERMLLTVIAKTSRCYHRKEHSL